MSGASYIDISRWFDMGVKKGAKFLIVACDTFDHEDYPIYCSDDKECLKEYDSHNNVNMQRVVEVYDLTLDKHAQMSKSRVFNLPERK